MYIDSSSDNLAVTCRILAMIRRDFEITWACDRKMSAYLVSLQASIRDLEIRVLELKGAGKKLAF